MNAMFPSVGVWMHLESAVSSKSSKISHCFSLGLGFGYCEGQRIIIRIIFLLNKPFSELLYPANGGGVILKETTPIKLIFYHRTIATEELCVDLQ